MTYIITGLVVLWLVYEISKHIPEEYCEFINLSRIVSLSSVMSPLKYRTPTTLYHGTRLPIAYEIYNTGLFLIGESVPTAIWMTNDFGTAQIYSGKEGGIVIINIDSHIKLHKQKAGVFIYRIKETKAEEYYYRVQGLNPTGILDYNGNRII